MKLLSVVLVFYFFGLNKELFGQKTDTRDVSFIYSTGKFLLENNFRTNDTIMVINSDTFFVYVTKLSDEILEIRICNHLKVLLEIYRSFNNLKEGEHIVYKDDSTKVLNYFHGGIQIGPEFGYYQNGSLQYIYDIDRDKKIGKNLGYYKNGFPWINEFYCDTSESSVILTYSQSGKLESKVFGKEGNKSYYQYYESGNLKISGNIVYDVRTPVGKWIEYYENSHIKSIKYFIFEVTSSYPIGTWTFYDINGKIVKTENHDE